MNDEKNKWQEYNEQTKNNPPRPIVLKTLDLFNQYKGNVIDVGCGAGNDSIFLYENDWNVLAIDKNASGLNSLQEKYPQIKISNMLFEDITELPQTDLIIANYSIPFCNPSYFSKFIDILKNSIVKNGRFAGNFFGLNDSWRFGVNENWGKSSEMTFYSAEMVKSLFDDFQIEYFNETEFDGKTVSGNDKHWHIIEIIAKK
jgi:SAM-dependent methyltransferase